MWMIFSWQVLLDLYSSALLAQGCFQHCQSKGYACFEGTCCFGGWKTAATSSLDLSGGVKAGGLLDIVDIAVGGVEKTYPGKRTEVV